MSVMLPSSVALTASHRSWADRCGGDRARGPSARLSSALLPLSTVLIHGPASTVEFTASPDYADYDTTEETVI